MSTEVDGRLCTDPSADRCPLPGLLGLLEAVRASTGAEPTLDGYRVTVQGRMTPVASSREPMTARDLAARLGEWDSPAFGLSTRTVLRVRRATAGDTGRADVPEQAVLRVGSVGGEHAVRTGDWWLDGNAFFSVDPVTPYVFAVDDLGRVDDDAIASNVSDLTRFVRAVISTLRPESVKVYTDAGELLPFNAHMAYWNGAEAFDRDIATIVHVFTEGLPILELPPLTRADAATGEFAFHLWRTREQRHHVQTALAQAVASRDTSAAITLPPGVGTDVDGVLAADAAPFNSFLDAVYVRAMQGR